MSSDGQRERDSATPLSYEPNVSKPASASPGELLLCAFIGFITMVAVGGLASAFLARTTSPSGMILFSAIAPAAALVATLALLSVLSRQSMTWIGLSLQHLKRSWKPAALSIAINLPATFLAMLFFSYLYKALHLQTETEHPLLRALKESPQWLPVVIVSAVVLAPALEELVFRGCVQGALTRMISHSPLVGRWVAILATSAIFVVVHGEWWMMPPLFVLSVGLGFSYAKTENLWVPMLTHAAFNAVSLALFLLGRG